MSMALFPVGTIACGPCLGVPTRDLKSYPPPPAARFCLSLIEIVWTGPNPATYFLALSCSSSSSSLLWLLILCALLLSLWAVLTESSGMPFCVGLCFCFRRYTKKPTVALITVNEPTTPPTIAPRSVVDSLILNGVFVP